MSFLSASILLFLVMDPFGNVPFFLSILKEIPERKRSGIIIRELLIALMVLLLFLFTGPTFLNLLSVSESSLHISGGIILFLIAIKMIFGRTEEIVQGIPDGDPLIVPLAIPSVAGPSAIITILLLTAQEPGRQWEWVLSLLLAWFLGAVILLLSGRLNRLLGQRGLSALARLMGLILTTVSVEMFLNGIRTFIE